MPADDTAPDDGDTASDGDSVHDDAEDGDPSESSTAGESSTTESTPTTESATASGSRETKFCSNCGAEIDAKAEICPECGVRQPGMAPDQGPDRLAAALLAIFLGGFGIHKFYLGQTKQGIIYLCFFWTFIPAVVGFVEGIIYLTKTDEEFRRRYA